MLLLFCIIWSSKNFTYKCNTLSAISYHGTIPWVCLLNDGALRLGVFCLMFCWGFCCNFLFVFVGFFACLVGFKGVFSTTETLLAKNSILIIYHLKQILDHVAKDYLLRKTQRKPTIENKYKFVSSTWPMLYLCKSILSAT